MRLLIQFLVLASVLVKVLCGPCPFCSCADPKPKIRTYYLRDPYPLDPSDPRDPIDPSDPIYYPLPIGRRPKPKSKVKICCSTDPNSGYVDPYGRYIKPKVSVCCLADPASPCYTPGGPIDPADPVKLCSCCLYPDGASCPQCFSVYQH